MIGKAWIEYILLVATIVICGVVAVFALPDYWWLCLTGFIPLGAALYLQERRYTKEMQQRFGNGRRRRR